MSYLVINTRPTLLSDELYQNLIKRGICVYNLPLIETIEHPLNTEQLSWLKTRTASDWNIINHFFLSTNAVLSAKKYLPTEYPLSRAYAIGKRTKQSLVALHFSSVEMSPLPYSSEAILQRTDLQQVHGETFILWCGTHGRKKINDTLKKRGAKVIRLEVYRQQKCLPKQDQLTPITNKQPLIVIATSKRILEVIAETPMLKTRDNHLICISERVANHAKLLGWYKINIAEQADTKGLIDAIEKITT